MLSTGQGQHLSQGRIRCLPKPASDMASVAFSSLYLTLIPYPHLFFPLSSLPVLCQGSSSCSSYSKTPLLLLPPPTQTAPPLPPPHRLTTIAAKRGKRRRTKRKKTRRSGKGSESTSPPKPVTAQIQTEFVALMYLNYVL